MFDPVTESLYRVVPWGDRTYLIEDGEMLRFCNAVNAGAEPRSNLYSRFFLRDRHWLITTPGLPDVPAQWAEWILPAGLVGRVEALGDLGTCWINLGSADGLRQRMLLTLHDIPMEQRYIDLGAPPTRREVLELARIEPRRSLVRCVADRYVPIEVGMRVTPGAVERP